MGSVEGIWKVVCTTLTKPKRATRASGIIASRRSFSINKFVQDYPGNRYYVFEIYELCQTVALQHLLFGLGAGVPQDRRLSLLLQYDYN